MNRIILLLASVIYFLLTSGVNLHIHYCCGKLAQVNFIEFYSCCCVDGVCNASACYSHKKCCETSDYFIQLDEDQRTPQLLSLKFWNPQLLSQFFYEVMIYDLPIQDYNFTATDSSPPPDPLFKLNCQFVFYG